MVSVITSTSRATNSSPLLTGRRSRRRSRLAPLNATSPASTANMYSSGSSILNTKKTTRMVPT